MEGDMSNQSRTARKYADKRVERVTRTLQWVRLGLMKIAPLAQRTIQQSWVDNILARFDPERLGTPEVNFRMGAFFVMDGQHRIEALKLWLGDEWDGQFVECWVTEGLTEEDEADTFLELNRKLNVSAFDKFRIAVRAKHGVETEIKAIVEAEGLRVARNRVGTEGAISAVESLRKVYQRDGDNGLHMALAIIRDAYGAAGLEAGIIDGFGLLCGRFGSALNLDAAVDALKKSIGGVAGLKNAAGVLRLKTGNARNHCIAAAAIEIINRKLRGAAKLTGWWQ